MRAEGRRTLTSVFDRDRSISFCRLRTRLRSPACDAVKIRCRSRRTFSSAESQLTLSQLQGSPFHHGGTCWRGLRRASCLCRSGV
jgi:hypothetical protein